MNGTMLKQVVVVALVLGTAGIVVVAGTSGNDLPADVLRATGGGGGVRSQTPKPKAEPAAKRPEPTTQPQTPSELSDATEEELDAKLERARVRYINVSNDFPKALEAWKTRMSQTMARLEKLQAEVRAAARDGAKVKSSKTKDLSTEPVVEPADRAKAGPQPRAEAESETTEATVEPAPEVEKTVSHAPIAGPPNSDADPLNGRWQQIATELERLAAEIRAMPRRKK